jgi:dGTPase
MPERLCEGNSLPCFRRLQGKTQLFPGHESDFFRNRLTHSLEVAQVAESIAYKINDEHPYFKEHRLEPRVCFTAALVHDIGHPPFGHNGEHALDDKMKSYGGFEGNAQTIRVISRLEKKRRLNPTSKRKGLTHVLASISRFGRLRLP